MKTKKLLAIVLSAAILLALPPTLFSAADTGALSIGSATAQAGEDVTVDVMMTENPGIVALFFSVIWDTDKLTLSDTSVVDGVANYGFDNHTRLSEANAHGQYNYYSVNSSSESNYTAKGKVVSLKFTVKETVTDGENIELKLEMSDKDTTDFNAVPVKFNATSGKVAIAAPPPSTTNLPPNTTNLPPNTTNLPPSTTNLPPSTTNLPPSTTSLPPSTTSLPPSTTSLPPSTTNLPPSTTNLPPSTTTTTTSRPPTITTPRPPVTTTTTTIITSIPTTPPPVYIPEYRPNTGRPRGTLITLKPEERYTTTTNAPASAPTATRTTTAAPSPSKNGVLDRTKPPLTYAQELYKLGLLYGNGINANGNPTFALEQELTRLEALAIVVRLTGNEKAAFAYTGQNPFTDVPQWGDRYAAYAYNAGVTAGISATLFAPNRSVTHQEFTAFLLRVLNYTEKNGDFRFENAIQKAVSIGLYTSKEATAKSPYLRGDAVLAMTEALFTKPKGSVKTLLDTLADSGAVMKENAAVFINQLTN